MQESEFEKVKRLYQKLFRSFYKHQDNDHHFKLKLYQHASEHQSGNYAQIVQDEIRIKHQGQG